MDPVSIQPDILVNMFRCDYCGHICKECQSYISINITRVTVICGRSVGVIICIFVV